MERSNSFPAQDASRETRIFISYSREDSDFAEHLRDDLIAGGYEAYLDKHDIRPGEPWQERLSALITRADMVVFCLSPDFVGSEICDWEVNEAERIGKRLLPVVVTEPDPDKVPGRLKRLNYIFMRDEIEFSDGLNKLETAINTDIVWIHGHTRFTERASEWLSAEKSNAALLRGHHIPDAEQWITQRPHAAPDITKDIGLYISASRQAETARERRARRRGRIITGASLTTAAFISWLGYLMYGQWQEGLRTQSKFLSEVSLKATEDGDAVSGILFALEALPDQSAGHLSAPRWRPTVPKAMFALDTAWRNGGVPPVSSGEALFREFELHDGQFVSAPVKAAFSSDGNTVLAASEAGGAKLWKVDGRLLVDFGDNYSRRSKSKNRLVHAVFGAQGKSIVTVSDGGTAQLWDHKGEFRGELESHCQGRAPRPQKCRINSVEFSPDGAQILTSSNDGTAKVWTSSGEFVRSLNGHKGAVLRAGFGPSGERIVTASRDGSAGLWDAKSGNLITFLNDHCRPGSFDKRLNCSVRSAVFSLDGTRVVTGADDNTAILWDSKTGKLIIPFRGHDDTVASAVFSPDGQRILTASKDKTAKLWTLDGKLLATLEGHTGPLANAVFSPSGDRILTASSVDSVDRTARLWSDAGELITILRGHCRKDGFYPDVEFPPCGVPSVAFSPNGRLILTGSNDGTARLWEVGGVATTFRGHTDQLNSAVFNQDGTRILTASNDMTARLWNVAGKELARLKGHTSTVKSAVFDADDRILTASADKTARLWDRDGKLTAVLSGHAGKLNTAVFSPDGQRILTASSDRTGRLWTRDGQLITVLTGHTGDVVAAVFDPGSRRFVTASSDKTARLWDGEGNLIAVLKGPSAVQGVEYSRDGQLIVTSLTPVGRNPTEIARLWNPDGQLIAKLTQSDHVHQVFPAKVSPDSRRILTSTRVLYGKDNPMKLWIADGKEAVNFNGHSARLLSAVFSPKGYRIATASSDSTAQIWHMSGQLLAELKGHRRAVVSVIFSPDGSKVLTASHDHTARLWDTIIDSEKFVDRAQKSVSNCLTAVQRKQFLPPLPPRWCYTRKLWPYHDHRNTPPPPLNWGEHAAQYIDAITTQFRRLFDRSGKG